MSGLRPIFISLYPVFLALVGNYAVVSIYQTSAAPLAWWGVLLTTVPFFLFLLRVMILQDLARTSRRLPIIQGLAVVGFFLAFFSHMVIGAPDYLALSLAAAGLALFTLYNFWYAERDPRINETLERGARLPQFTLEDSLGQIVSNEDLSAGPTFMLFFRGNWCPFCMGQIKEIAAEYKALETLGVDVALISPQPQHKTAKLATKYEVNFRFFTDQDNRAAKALGIECEDSLPLGLGLLGYSALAPLPTIILVGTDGHILFAKSATNYRVRPEPRTLLAILGEAQAD